MPGIVFLTVSWAILGATLFGLGVGAFCALGFRHGSRVLLLGAVPLGYCLVIAFLQVWHLWLPVTHVAFLILLPVAGLGLLAGRKLFMPVVARARWAWLVFGAIVLALTVWVADRALGVGDHFDSGIYHWNAIRWANAFAILPGLANVHVRLGFNNASLLFDAMLNTGYWAGRAGNLGNGFMVMLLWLYAAYGLVQLSRGRGRGRFTPFVVVAAALIFPALSLCAHNDVNSDLASPDTDPPLAVLSLLGGVHLIALLLEDEDKSVNLVMSVVCLTTAVCLKLSGAYLLAAAVPIWLLVLRRDAVDWPLRRARPAVGIVLLCTLLLGVWVLRTIILTGYPLFPSTLVSLPVDWRVPVQQVKQQETFILLAARYRVATVDPHTPLGSWAWLPLFFQRMPWNTTWYCLESGAIVWLACWLLGRSGARGRCGRCGRCGRMALYAAVILVALVCWFLATPDIRFGWHLFWLFALGAVALLPELRWGRAALALWTLPIIVVPLVRYDGWLQMARQRPGPDFGFYRVTTPDHLQRRTLSDGNSIMVSPMIWDFPAPSTSEIDVPFHQRDQKDITKGFAPDETGVAPILPREQER